MKGAMHGICALVKELLLATHRTVRKRNDCQACSDIGKGRCLQASTSCSFSAPCHIIWWESAQTADPIAGCDVNFMLDRRTLQIKDCTTRQ